MSWVRPSTTRTIKSKPVQSTYTQKNARAPLRLKMRLLIGQLISAADAIFKNTHTQTQHTHTPALRRRQTRVHRYPFLCVSPSLSSAYPTASPDFPSCHGASSAAGEKSKAGKQAGTFVQTAPPVKIPRNLARRGHSRCRSGGTQKSIKSKPTGGEAEFLAESNILQQAVASPPFALPPLGVSRVLPRPSSTHLTTSIPYDPSGLPRAFGGRGSVAPPYRRKQEGAGV